MLSETERYRDTTDGLLVQSLKSLFIVPGDLKIYIELRIGYIHN